jgi:ABC-type branched-subunit amino acid transport system substrate-binding protein
MKRARWGRIGLGMCLVLLAAACGARVTPEQRAAVGGGQRVAAGPASGSEFSVGGRAEVAAEDTPVDAGSPSGGETGTGETATTVAAAVRTASDVGITPDKIVLGHVTQLTGPVPGLFKGSTVGILAYAAYQNSLGGLGGRKIEVDIRDDQFDSSQNRNQTKELIAKSFALVGGISLYDDASAGDVRDSGIPDLTTAITTTRANLPNNFAPSPNIDGAPLGPFQYLKQKYPQAVTAMASVYGDVPAAKHVHESYRMAAESVGFKWVYDRGYQPTETDYTADIIRMRQAGAKGLFMMSVDAKNIARVLKAAQQQGWKPDVIFLGAAGYDRVMANLAGTAAEGVQLFLGYSLYAGEDAEVVPEVKLMNQWVQKVSPGYVADTYTVGAWLAGRLFQQEMAKVGPNPTRKALNDALRGVDHYDGNGLSADTGPGIKRPATCYLIAEFHEGRYRRVDPTPRGFRCDAGYWRRPA